MQKLFAASSFLILSLCFLLLLPSPTHAFAKQTNYQGRAFDANNKFVANGCYSVQFEIGRFANRVVAPIGNPDTTNPITPSYTQPSTNVTYSIPVGKILNTHPTQQCPSGQAYVENGLFNVLLNLDSYDDTNFMASTLPFYGIRVNFNGNGLSLWQPFVEDNWLFPNNQNNAPQSSYYLGSHQDPAGSWGLWTNHGLWANGGLGAPTFWAIGGDFAASRLTISAGGGGGGWYSTIQASDTYTASPGYNTVRPLKLNPAGGNVEIGGATYISGENKLHFGNSSGTGEYIYSQRSPRWPLILSAGFQDRVKIYSDNGDVVVTNKLCTGDCSVLTTNRVGATSTNIPNLVTQSADCQNNKVVTGISVQTSESNSGAVVNIQLKCR